MQETTTNEAFSPLMYALNMADEFGLSDSDIPTSVAQCTDRAAVNKLLMQLATAKTEAHTALVDKDILEHIKENSGKLDSSPQVQTWQYNINSRLNEVRRYHDSIIAKLKDNARDQASIDSFINAPPPDIAGATMKAITALGWELDKATLSHKDRVVFKTGIIPLVFKRPEAGIDYKLPMGPYHIEWNVPGNYIEVFPIQNETKLQVDQYPHPHVNNGGGVCWGTGHGAMIQALQKYDLLTAGTILDAILRSYNPESPYIRIDDFAEQVDPLIPYGSEYEFQRYGNRWSYYRTTADSHRRMYDMWQSLTPENKPPLIDPGDTLRVPGQTENNPRGTSSYKQILVPLYRVMHKTAKTRAINSPYYTKIGDQFFKLSESYEYGKFTIESTPTHAEYLNSIGVPF